MLKKLHTQTLFISLLLSVCASSNLALTSKQKNLILAESNNSENIIKIKSQVTVAENSARSSGEAIVLIAKNPDDNSASALEDSQGGFPIWIWGLLPLGLLGLLLWYLGQNRPQKQETIIPKTERELVGVGVNGNSPDGVGAKLVAEPTLATGIGAATLAAKPRTVPTTNYQTSVDNPIPELGDLDFSSVEANDIEEIQNTTDNVTSDVANLDFSLDLSETDLPSLDTNDLNLADPWESLDNSVAEIPHQVEHVTNNLSDRNLKIANPWDEINPWDDIEKSVEEIQETLDNAKEQTSDSKDALVDQIDFEETELW